MWRLGEAAWRLREAGPPCVTARESPALKPPLTLGPPSCESDVTGPSSCESDVTARESPALKLPLALGPSGCESDTNERALSAAAVGLAMIVGLDTVVGLDVVVGWNVWEVVVGSKTLLLVVVVGLNVRARTARGRPLSVSSLACVHVLERGERSPAGDSPRVSWKLGV